MKGELSHILFRHAEAHPEGIQPVVPPIYGSVNFAFGSLAELAQGIAQEYKQPFYSRGTNPTATVLRQKLAALEGADDALICASGSAAIALAFLALLQAGDHVLCVDKPYGWTQHLLTRVLQKFGVSHTFADGRHTDHFLAQVQPHTRMIYLESPNSLTFEQQDIKAIAAFARANHIFTVIDNSYSTPLYQSPLAMGVDLVIHSATKYLSGHSDVLAGVLLGRKDLIERIFSSEWMALGAVADAQVCTALLKGLRTLPLRLERSAQTGLLLARRLEAHPAVACVHHPLLDHYPQAALSREQLRGAGGLFSFELIGKAPRTVAAFADSLKHFHLATSWGGYESLVLPMAAFVMAEKNLHPFISPMLIRLYAGLEDPEWLWEDLEAALNNYVNSIAAPVL